MQVKFPEGLSFSFQEYNVPRTEEPFLSLKYFVSVCAGNLISFHISRYEYIQVIAYSAKNGWWLAGLHQRQSVPGLLDDLRGQDSEDCDKSRAFPRGQLGSKHPKSNSNFVLLERAPLSGPAAAIKNNTLFSKHLHLWTIRSARKVRDENTQEPRLLKQIESSSTRIPVNKLQ